MVISAMLAAMILVSGIRWRFIFGLVSGIFATAVTLTYIFTHTKFFKAHILQEYQLNRFYGWLAPYKYDAQGYQLRQAFLATGSGKCKEKVGKMDKYTFQNHIQILFSLMSLNNSAFRRKYYYYTFFLLIFRMIHIALESNDPFGSYICAGTIGMFTFQVFQNIGMTIGLLPITGITLPLMSYGGSSLLTYMIAIGFVLNVRSRTKIFMFN